MALAAVPPLFRCPISLELMKNPVTLCTGITYERESIEKWIREGNLTCPATMQSIHSTDLVPNITLQRLIQSSFRDELHKRPDPIPHQATQNKTDIVQRVRRLGESVSEENPTPSASAAVVDELRAIRMWLRANQLKSTETREELVKSIIQVLESGSQEACEEAVIIISGQLSISGIRDHKLLAQSVSRIISSGTTTAPESKSHAAAIVERLAESDWELKVHLGSTPGLLTGLCSMLSSRRSVRAALAAIHSLLGIRRIRSRLIEAGAVRAIIEILPELDSSRSCTELGLCVLELMCRTAEGRAEFAAHELGMFAVCKKMFRVSSAATEFTVGIMWSLCKYSADESVRRRAVDASAFERLLLLLHVECSAVTKQRVCDLLRLLRQEYSEEPCIIASPGQALPAAVIPIYPRFY